MNDLKDPVDFVANLILNFGPKELAELRRKLEDGSEGGMAGVGAVIPPNLPLQEGAAEVDLPEDYWETAQ